MTKIDTRYRTRCGGILNLCMDGYIFIPLAVLVCRSSKGIYNAALHQHAHENEKELRPFRQHLTHLSQQGYIQVWHDSDLVPGELWEPGIADALQRADIVLIFYTTAARISDFIQQTELPTALARADAKQCTVLWVPLERNDLDAKQPLEQRLARITCATTDAQPVYDFEIVQKGWMEVEQAIRRAVEQRRRATP